MAKYYQTSARKIRMMGPCYHGLSSYIKHFGEVPITFDRETCSAVVDKLNFADIAWFIASVRDERRIAWYNKMFWLSQSQRKNVLYRAVNKSTLNDILMAFGL